MRKFLIPLAAALAFAAAPAFAQGSGSSGDIGGAASMGSGSKMSDGMSGGNMKNDAMAPKKKMKKSAKKM